MKNNQKTHPSHCTSNCWDKLSHRCCLSANAEIFGRPKHCFQIFLMICLLPVVCSAGLVWVFFILGFFPLVGICLFVQLASMVWLFACFLHRNVTLAVHGGAP